MEWYPGSINDAVKTSKLNRAVFVVFVAGNDEASLEVTKVIDTPEISSSLKKDNFVAIKLESGTEDYNFFAQIYQLVPVPSLFFIGHSGQPLEVVAGSVTASNLKEKIDAVLVKVGKSSSNASSAFINAEQGAASALNIPQSSATNSNVIDDAPINRTTESPSADIKATSSANVEVKSEQTEATASNSADGKKSDQEFTAEEKLERARKLIELQKQQQMEKEKEEERRRELERRDIGKNVQNARRRQQDMELALAHEERMKEKALEREARERVMQQIAQDKLERKHREQALLQQTSKSPPSQEPPLQAAAFVGDGYARIQFRLPSGNPHMGKFEENTTLRELRAYVSGNIDLPFRQFSMSMSFPRRDLGIEDDDRTLLDLELVPTAVILILPDKNVCDVSGTSAVAADHFFDNFFFRFAWTLLWPVRTVYSYLASYFPGGSNGGTNSQSNGSSAAGGSERSGAFGANNVGSSSDFMGRNMGESSRTVRARGNVHRLHSGGDDNDENNTWNGNSTQQM